ncbi:MAG: peptidase C1 [Bacteroidales bacterium]|nr:MAG: peptidase C1 [Bacteroidales bacterium]
MVRNSFFTLIFLGLASSLFAQSQDKSEFINVEPGFYQKSILKDVNAVNEIQKPQVQITRFQMVQDITKIPNKISDYKKFWSFPPVSQGNTNTCWCFSTTSFIESEVKRIYNKEIRISEMFTVYNEYIEKARRYVKERGNSAFGEGSEGNALTRMFRMYGCLPLSIYSALPAGRKYHTHEALYNELNSYLESVKSSNSWNEELVISTVKSMLNYYLGEPPVKFMFEGKEYTPISFLKDYVKINPDDYVEILSYKQEPYWQQVEYKVPDNWWHSTDYYNVPLDVYMDAIKKGIRNGYTMSIGGDVSEPGFSRTTQAAMIPSFDIPSAFINDDARQFRFTNETTTDDHGIHLVGYCERDGKDWYLIKDSGSGSRNNDSNAPEFGYYFFHEDYVKLKMMGFTIHKDAVKDILAKFKK